MSHNFYVLVLSGVVGVVVLLENEMNILILYHLSFINLLLLTYICHKSAFQICYEEDNALYNNECLTEA